MNELDFSFNFILIDLNSHICLATLVLGNIALNLYHEVLKKFQTQVTFGWSYAMCDWWEKRS